MTTYELTIPGEPMTKARPRITKTGIAFTPKATKEYETFVRELFFHKHKILLLEGAVKAEIAAYFPIPKSASKKLKALMATEQHPHTKNKDADNIAKAILDALNGVAYADDKQVAELVVKKRYSDVPRVELSLQRLESDA